MGNDSTNLDTGHLQRMNGIWNTILELIFNGSRAQQEHILLDDLRSFIQSFTASIYSRSCPVVDRYPFPIFSFRNITVGDAKGSKTLSSIVLMCTQH